MGNSTLGSVLTGVYLSHGANPDDKKYLIFNDSVQDTAHQAGYISARTFRFNVRRLCYHITKSLSKDKMSLEDVSAALHKKLKALWQGAQSSDKDATSELVNLIPQDLWEFWLSKKKCNP